MRIISRYLLREISGFFFICLFTFTTVLFTLRILRLSSLVINKGVSLGQVATVFLAIVPAFLELALPLAALLGVMLAFNRLSGDSEIIVLRSSGISLYSLLLPVGIFGAVLTAFNFYVSFELRPWGFTKLSAVLLDISKAKSTAGLNAGVFNELGKITLYAESIDDATGLLSKVTIDDRRDEAARKIITARHGKIRPEAAADKITISLADGFIHETSGDKYYITDYTTNNIVLDPEEIYEAAKSEGKRPNRELSITALRNRIEQSQLALTSAPEESQGLPHDSAPLIGEEAPRTKNELRININRARLEIARRYATPIASLILTFVAMALGILPPRTQKSWGAGFSAALGLGVFIIYYSFLSLGIALGESGIIYPALGVWFPNMVGASIAVYLHSQMGRERWQSIAHGIEELCSKLLTRVRRAEA